MDVTLKPRGGVAARRDRLGACGRGGGHFYGAGEERSGSHVRKVSRGPLRRARGDKTIAADGDGGIGRGGLRNRKV